MADLNSQQVGQVRMLLRALLRASNSLSDAYNKVLSDDRAILTTRRCAADALVQARLRLEKSERNVCDIKVKHLLLHLGPAETSQVRNVLESFLPKEPTLTDFGKVPWREVEAVFAFHQTRCPLALQVFHAEYQQELHVGSNLSAIVSSRGSKTKKRP